MVVRQMIVDHKWTFGPTASVGGFFGSHLLLFYASISLGMEARPYGSGGNGWVIGVATVYLVIARVGICFIRGWG